MSALTFNAKRADELRTKIVDIEGKIEGGVVGQTRQIMAQALTKGRLDSFLRSFGIKLIDDESIEILTEQIVFGNIDNLLASVSEGATNFALGATYNESVLQLVKDLGVEARPLRLDLTTARKQYAASASAAGFGTRAITTDMSESSLVGYLLRFSFYGNDEFGSLALANVDLPEDQAIRILTDWLKTPRGIQLKKEATAVNDLELDDIKYATEIFTRAKALVTRRDGKSINTELLNKIRQVDPSTPLGKGVKTYTITGKLGLDDVRDMDINDLPLEYVGPELVPVVEEAQRTSSIIKNGWVWLGLANARLSRQPLAIYESISIRKEMRKTGFEQAFVDNWTKGLTKGTLNYNNAVKVAKKELATAAEERAIQQVLSYVDNPLIRSQVSFSLRNWARFYRAQEDFYRRLGRLARYNPEAFARSAAVFDGIDHNGFIQKDDQGDAYFVYPMTAPGYKAIQAALAGMGIPQDFKIPLPVQFGGSVKMLTPSLNPDSIMPTFSGPLAGLSISVLTNLIDLPFGGQTKATDTIRKVLLGTYAVDQPIIDRIMPAHVNRALKLMSQDEKDSQYASAYRKAVTYLEATGNALPKRYDENKNLLPNSIAEREAYREKVKNATLAILATRFVYSFVLPASPAIQLKSEMAEWVKDSNNANWKQVWYDLMDKNDGDPNAAMLKWVELYPNQVPYTVSESERKTVGFFRSAEDSADFVESNKELFDNYKEGAAFLIPHSGAFSFDAYRTMKSMGLRSNKRVEDYLLEVQTASDVQEYFEKKEQFDATLITSVDPAIRKILRSQYNSWKDSFFAGRPLVQEWLGRGRENQIERVRALDDLDNMLNDSKFANIRPETQKVLRDMVDTYKSYQSQKDAFEMTGQDADILDILKSVTLRKLEDLSGLNENTRAAYISIFSRILGE